MHIHGIKLRLFIPSVVIIVLSIILVFTHSTSAIVGYVGYVLGFYRELRCVFWVITLVCCVCYFISTRKMPEGGKELFIRLMGPIPDLILSIIGYGMMFHTGITMLHGIFKQYFRGYQFINDIGNNDLLIIAILMIGVLFWSITQLYKLATDAYTYSRPAAEIKEAEKQSKEEGQDRQRSQ